MAPTGPEPLEGRVKAPLSSDTVTIADALLKELAK
jgi:hypothetical protein